MNHDALKRAFENGWRLLLVLEPWRTIERNFFGFERNILLYNLFDRRNRNSSLKTRSNLSRNLFSNRSMTKEAWPTFLEESEFLGTMRTKGTVRQVGWQMKFELLTSRFLPSFLCNAQRYFVPRRKIHRRRFNAIFANSRTRWSRSFCFQLLRIKIDETYN